MRDSCIFYRSFYEAIQDLPQENQLEIYNAIFAYTLDFKDIELKGISATVFKLIKPNLEANIQRYKNGKKAKQKQTESETEAKLQQSFSNKDKDKDKDENNDVDVGENPEKIETPTFVMELKEQLDEDFYQYCRFIHTSKCEIELKPEYASKQNAYFMLVPNIPLFKNKLKYLPNQSQRHIENGIKDWLKYNTVKKTSVTWHNWAEMAQHCINYIIKSKSE